MLSVSVAALGFQAPVAPVPASVSAINMMDKSGLETLAKDLNPVRTQPRPRALFFPTAGAARADSSRLPQADPFANWSRGGGWGGWGLASVGCRGGCVWGTSQVPSLHFFCLEDLSPLSNLP